jgi:hypothetical protein
MNAFKRRQEFVRDGADAQFAVNLECGDAYWTVV